MLKIGSIVGGKYKVLSLIGQGGMSRVYLVMNERTNKTWAIKEVRKNGTNSSDIIRQNLIVEADILKTLHHPHLPSIVDIIDQDDTYLILMDYIEGMPLSRVLKEKGPQKQTHVIRWALQMCDVLGYLHTRDPKIIYRDMKPENIMLKPNGEVVLIDFGTAREYKEGNTSDTTYLGTRGYAAPEQYGKKGQTDERTDIYNLGVTMYHLVTGHTPTEPPYELRPITYWNPNLSTGLEKIIMKCTRQNPEDRYQSCGELKYALLHYEEMEYQGIRKRRRHFQVFASVFLIGILSVSAGIVLRAYAGNVLHDTYESVLSSARKAVTQEEREALYKKAISVRPEEGETYQELLEQVYLIDGHFSQKEAESMKMLLESNASGKTYEEMLKRNRADYDSFSYEMGLAYFYYYGENGNKQASKPWFDTAAASVTLSDAQVSRSKIFAEIASYYDQMGIRDKAGDSSISYKDYWNSLRQLTDGNLVQIDNKTTAMVAYNEVIYHLIMHAPQFIKAGVTAEEMQEKLTDIETHLDGDFADLTEEEAVIMTELKNGLTQARQTVTNADAGLGVANDNV